MVTLTIDDKRIEAGPEQTVLEAALAHGIEIPHICWDKRLEPFGGCRMCVVEIEGMPDPVTSCTTAVREGMVVRTDTDRLRTIRATITELLLSDHPRSCLSCPQTGECKLQDSAYEFGLEEFLPVEHEIGEDRFTAEWKVSGLAGGRLRQPVRRVAHRPRRHGGHRTPDRGVR